MEKYKSKLIEVYHSNLKRIDEDSMFKSACPVCEKGVLLVHRDQETYKFLEIDRCISCGQEFKYLDIKDIGRRK